MCPLSIARQIPLAPALHTPYPPTLVQKGNDTLMLRTLMLMVTRGKCGLVSLLLCLVPLISFAGPPPSAPFQVHSPDEDSSWKRINEVNENGYEKDRVDVFLRERPGNTIKEALAKSVVDAPPCRVFQVLKDSDRLVEFMPYLEVRITKNVSADTEYICEYLDFPWPVGDRLISLRVDDVLNYRENRCEYLVRWRKDETYACTVDEARMAYEDAVSDPIVPPVCEGYWHLLPQNGGEKTLVSYYGFTDPGGRIPPWIQNMFTQSAIVKLFRAVRERATQSDLYPPCQCDQPSTLESPGALGRENGYPVESSVWR